MKKVLIILSTVLGLGFVSCQKQEFTQNSTSEMELPVWDEGARMSDDGDDTDFNDDVEGITDPNDENDEPANDEESGRTQKGVGFNSVVSGN